MVSILAFDIDLNRIHAVSNVLGVICENSKVIPFEAIKSHDIILIEVASANFYSDNLGQIYNRAKWVIFNSMIAGRIYEYSTSEFQKVLVAPSSAWTCGYPELIRHSLAGISEGSHDIRECKAMLFFHATNPAKWIPFTDYFESLSTKNKGKNK